MLRLVVFLILLQHAHSFCMVTPDANGRVSAEALSAKLNGATIIGTASTNYYDQYFHECTTLKSIDIPASVKTIGYYAFYNSYVAKVSYNGTDMSLLQLQGELGTRAYNSGTTKTGVTVYYDSDYSFPSTPYTGCPLADKTASHAIYTGNSISYCRWLTSVTIPSSVTSIGHRAFYETTNLKSVDFSGATNLKTIGSSAFYSTGLKSVDFSGATNLTEIGSHAFGNANALTSIDLRQATKLRKIGSSAFYYYHLSGFLFLPATFFDVDGADTMLSAAIQYADILRHCMVTPDSNGHVNATALSANLINNSLGLGSRFRWVTGFYKCNTLKSIEIPATVTSIGASAFYDTALTSVTIPSSVTSIGASAFSSTALTSVDFSGATALEEIGGGAFYGTDLTSVTIPSSVTSIGASAFSGTDLTSIDFSGATALEEIVSGAFYNTALTTVIIPESVKTIGGTWDYAYGAFAYNDITELAILGTPTFYEFESTYPSTYYLRTFQRKAPYGPLQLKRFCGSYIALPSKIKAQISTTHAVTDCTFWCATGSGQISTNYHCTKPWSTSCAAGSYLAPKPAGMQVSMSDTCTPCPAGTFQSIPGSNATSCTTCPTGMFQPNSLSVACDQPWSTCSQGQYWTAGSTTTDATCTPCPAGTFQSIPGSNATECTAWTPSYSAVYVGKVLLSLGTATADHQWGDIPACPALITYHPNDLKAALDTRCAL